MSNHNSILFLALILFNSCQNTPRSTHETQIGTSSSIAKATPEQLQQAEENLTTCLNILKELQHETDALPINLRKEKEKDIEGINVSLAGMIAKQSQMIKELKGISSGVSLNETQIQVYNEYVVNYTKEAQQIQEKMNAWEER